MAVVLLAPLFAIAAAAQSTPQLTRVQGFLSEVNGGGQGTPADGTFSMSFDLYDSEFGGLLVSSDGPLSVVVTDGVYSVDLALSVGRRVLHRFATTAS